MDIFCEYIIKKQPTVKDLVMRLGIIMAAIILSFILIVINSMLMGFGFILIVAVIYGAVFLFRKTKVEYEYILTNSILDIDKIFAKSSRKRAVSIDFKNVEAFGRASEAPTSPAKELDYSSNINDSNVFYFEFFKDGEKKRVFFQPNQKILDNLHKVAPKLVPVYMESNQ